MKKHFCPDNWPDKEANLIVYFQEGDKIVFEEGGKGKYGRFLYEDIGKKIGYAVPDDIQLEYYPTPF